MPVKSLGEKGFSPGSLAGKRWQLYNEKRINLGGHKGVTGRDKPGTAGRFVIPGRTPKGGRGRGKTEPEAGQPAAKAIGRAAE